MGFGQKWPERVPRPKARRLTEEEKDEILATLRKVIAGSPVLSSFGVEVQSSRGRFYIQRQREDDDFLPTRRNGAESRRSLARRRNCC